MKFIKKLFGIGKTQIEEKPKDVDVYDEYEELFVEKVINMLKTQPENFSAKWSSDFTLDKSVRYKKNKLFILISTGEIFQPIEPRMSKEQKVEVKKLISYIVKRDRMSLIDSIDK
jgi:hypothetical protein